MGSTKHCSKPRPHCVLQASCAEIEEDSQHLLHSRPGHICTGFGPLSATEVARAQAAIASFSHRRIQRNDVCAWEDLVVHVGDEPRGGWLTWSGVSHKIPTLRRSSGLLVSVVSERQITLPELFSCMGVPALAVCALAAGTPLYSLNRSTFSYFDYVRALGNSQHCANVGTVMAAALASCVVCG